MVRLVLFLMIGVCCQVCVTPPALGADALTALKRFSDFSTIDITRLLEGEILSQRGSLMNFPNGISSQFCFVAPTSPAETANRLQKWDPTRCTSLKVYVSRRLSNPCEIKEFSNLSLYLNPGHRPIKRFFDQTMATSAGTSGPNLTRSEARELAGCVGKDAGPKTLGACWARLLFARASDFQRTGFAGTLPYESGETTVNPSSQIRSMLQEQVRITREFAPLLKRAGLVSDGEGVSPLRPDCFWSLFEADHRATLNLGAMYELNVGDRRQLLSIEYYVSGTYYASATLYEIWPFRYGGKTGSLIWRGDLFAAPQLRFTKGIERIASGAIMIQEIKKEVRCFQESLAYP